MIKNIERKIYCTPLRRFAAMLVLSFVMATIGIQVTSSSAFQQACPGITDISSQ